MNFKKILCLILVLAAVLTLAFTAVSCKDKGENEEKEEKKTEKKDDPKKPEKGPFDGEYDFLFDDQTVVLTLAGKNFSFACIDDYKYRADELPAEFSDGEQYWLSELMIYKGEFTADEETKTLTAKIPDLILAFRTGSTDGEKTHVFSEYLVKSMREDAAKYEDKTIREQILAEAESIEKGTDVPAEKVGRSHPALTLTIRVDTNAHKAYLVKEIAVYPDGETETTGFDENGKPTESVSVYEDEVEGKVVERCVYEYDEKGDLVKKTYTDENEKPLAVYLYENGRETQVSRYRDGVLYNDVRFDENGETLEETDYYENGKIKTRMLYKDGKAVEKTFYAEDGTVERTVTFGEENEESEIIYKNGLPVLKSVTVNGKLMLEIEFDEKGNEYYETRYDYYPSGMKKNVSSYFKGILSEVSDFSEDGLNEKQVRYKEDGSVFQTIYSVMNSAGNIVDQKWYNNKGVKITDITANENGNVLLEINYDDDGTEFRRDEYEYDENGFCVHEVCKYLGKVMSEMIYRPKDRMRTTVYYNDLGVLGSSTVEYFDENGKKIRTENCKSDGTVYREEIFNEIEEPVTVNYYENGKLDFVYSYTYNDRRIRIRVVCTNADGTLYSENIFSDNGRSLSETVYDEKGNITEQYIYDYYPNGNIKSSLQYGAGGVLRAEVYFNEDGHELYENLYDVNGNLTEYAKFEYYESGAFKHYEDVFVDGGLYRERDATEDGLYSIDKYYDEGVLSMTDEIEYYLNGFIKSFVEKNGSGKIFYAEYYDEEGNLIG